MMGWFVAYVLALALMLAVGVWWWLVLTVAVVVAVLAAFAGLIRVLASTAAWPGW